MGRAFGPARLFAEIRPQSRPTSQIEILRCRFLDADVYAFVPQRVIVAGDEGQALMIFVDAVANTIRAVDPAGFRGDVHPFAGTTQRPPPPSRAAQ